MYILIANYFGNIPTEYRRYTYILINYLHIRLYLSTVKMVNQDLFGGLMSFLVASTQKPHTVFLIYTDAYHKRQKH